MRLGKILLKIVRKKDSFTITAEKEIIHDVKHKWCCPNRMSNRSYCCQLCSLEKRTEVLMSVEDLWQSEGLRS